ncbi:hypothetical protein SAMN06269185_3289 [Natronoarchaeum philippinense]|uniref:DUF7344 domain-containing protein n=1 Tax=Natronoarchaeum philippinense TaxID=558529 RepID=A0A285P8X8_NATPI|nr:hypothetical protein [Natronoarchaeum philippinense]SNZ18195.1 hypothetical protein SAMN06269185_3289 [Natronoarchaeum philippinense]
MTAAAAGCIPMEPDDAFEAVANSRRRQTLLSLDRAEGPVAAGDLAVEIAAIEQGIDPSHVTGEQRTRVYIALTQNHLDKLDELGAVNYNDRSKQVAPSDSTSSLAEHVRKLTTDCYEPTEGEQ